MQLNPERDGSKLQQGTRESCFHHSGSYLLRLCKMSPTSVCYTETKAELQGVGATPRGSSLGAGKQKVGSGSSFQFGIRKQEKVSETSSPPLRVSRDSHRIRKQALPLPPVQYRPPIIIHTYSPKVIHTQPDDFMSLVQKLTGSSDTRLRLKRKPAKKSSVPASDQNLGFVNTAADLEQQGSMVAHVASPSSSEEESAFQPSESCGGDLAMKQSHSPRSPLSNFEFDNHDLMFTPFDASSSNSLFSHVKTEPSFSFNDSSFNFLTETFNSQPLKGLSKQEAIPKQLLQHDYSTYHSNIDINSPVPTPGFLPSSSIAGLPDHSLASANWSQPFLDYHTGAPSRLPNQCAILRQRFLGGYTPSPEGTMVALENIQAFMLS